MLRPEADMTSPSASHSTFVIERQLAATVARVFAAWSNADKKRRWFACHDDWQTIDYQLDFRVDGSELNDVADSDGTLHAFRARYLDIVPDQRIVYVYDMSVGGARISASLVTVVLQGQGKGTKLIFTEQVVFLDGYGDAAERREGTDVGLSRLEGELGD